MLAQSLRVLGVVIGYKDRVVLNSYVSFESREVGISHVLGVPVRRGRGEPLAELVNRGLGHQGHRHLTVANIEIARPCTVPAECLMSVEKLLHVPAFGKLVG